MNEKGEKKIMYTKILAPLDGSQLAECTFTHVDAIINGGGVKELVLARVLEPLQLATYADADGFMGAKDIEKLIIAQENEAKNYLDKTKRRFQKQGLNVRIELLTGQVADTLSDFATKEGFDLIIMATHGRGGISRWAFGSVADRVMRSVNTPVLMVRAPGCIIPEVK
jgi:nucleotide-binding universal stress UspA family protein